jgi:hypothetical protein
VNVDVYATLAGALIPATPMIANFQPRQIVDLPNVGPATVDIRIFAAGADLQRAWPVIAVLGAAVPGPGEVSNPRAPRRHWRAHGHHLPQRKLGAAARCSARPVACRSWP